MWKQKQKRVVVNSEKREAQAIEELWEGCWMLLKQVAGPLVHISQGCGLRLKLHTAPHYDSLLRTVFIPTAS